MKVLGAAAGGGFPQWNCNGRMSARVRKGEPSLKPRTQSSLALSSNGRDWVLLNASPDLRQQINETRELWPDPDGPVRNSPIKAVVLTNGDVDHVIGLINLREGQTFSLYASARVVETVNENSVFNVLNPENVERVVLELNEPLRLRGAGVDLGLSIEAFDVPGKVALYLEDASKGDNFGTETGDTIGLKVVDSKSGRSFFYVPGCAEIDDVLGGRLKGAALVMFDGTLYTDDEMIAQGLSRKTGARMGHISMSGPDGSVAAFESLDVQRKVFIHINNSNPVLDDNSPERKAIAKAGWEAGFDGMEIEL